MQRLDPGILQKLSKKLRQDLQALREKVAKRANRASMTSEAALILIAKEHGISTGSYLGRLSPHIQEQVRSHRNTVAPAVASKPTRGNDGKPSAVRPNWRAVAAALIQDEQLLKRCGDLLYASGRFDRVFREASTVFDDRLKRVSGIRKGRPADLVSRAVNPDPLKAIIVVSDDADAQQRFHMLCKGLILYYRNESHHSLSEPTRADALRFCSLVDALLAVLKSGRVNKQAGGA